MLLAQTGDMLGLWYEESNSDKKMRLGLFVTLVLLLLTPIQAQDYIGHASMSPDRQWVIQAQQNNARYGFSTILLTHFPNQRQIVIEIDSVFAPVSPYEALFQWSPNSRFVVYEVFDPTLNQSVLHVYDVVDSQLLSLVSDRMFNSEYFWLPNNQFGVVRLNEKETFWLNIYDLPSTAISEVFFLTENRVCEINWSPDSRYLSFVSACPTAYPPEKPKELYILDRTTWQLWQATNFTEPYRPFVTQIALYDTHWLDATRLQIEVEYQTRNRNGRASTIYDVASQSFEVFEDYPTPQIESEQVQTYVERHNVLTHVVLIKSLNTIDGDEHILAMVSADAGYGFVDAVTSQNRLYTRLEFENPVTGERKTLYYEWATGDIRSNATAQENFLPKKYYAQKIVGFSMIIPLGWQNLRRW